MMPERNTFISRINVRFKYDYKDFYSTEDISRMSYVMWKVNELDSKLRGSGYQSGQLWL